MSDEVIAPIEVGRTWMQAGEVVAEARPSRPGDVSGDPWTWWVHSRLAGGMCHGGARSLDEAVAYAQRYLPDELEPTPATEAPTAPSEPDEGAVSPAGPGEAVRPRCGHHATALELPPEPRPAGVPNVGPLCRDCFPEAWREAVRPRVAAWDEGDRWATQVRRLRTTGALRASAWPNGAWATEGCGHGTATTPTLDAAKAAADAALEAAGYVLEGGAHVDPEDDEAARARAFVARARTFVAPELAAIARAEVARLTEARDARDEARALLDRIAEALGVPDDWRDLADDVLEATAADWREQAKRHEDAATVARGEVAVLREALARLTGQAESAEDVARVLRCEPGDVAGAAQAALEQAALARGEAAGLERALRVLAEVRRG